MKIILKKALVGHFKSYIKYDSGRDAVIFITRQLLEKECGAVPNELECEISESGQESLDLKE